MIFSLPDHSSRLPQKQTKDRLRDSHASKIIGCGSKEFHPHEAGLYNDALPRALVSF